MLSFHPQAIRTAGLVLALSACQTQKNPSQVLITAGVPIDESNYPEVVKLRRDPDGLCSGTFIRKNPNVLLTASHCLSTLPTSANHDVGLSYKGTAALRACLPDGANGKFGPRDVAVVIYPQSVHVPAVVGIAAEPPVKGEAVAMIGYGRFDSTEDPEDTGSGIKRLGKNKVRRIMPADSPKPGMIHVLGNVAGELETEEELDAMPHSATARGDSGGPLFVGEPRVIVGVTSGGSDKNGWKSSYFVNLTDSDIQEFLANVLSDEALTLLASGQMSETDYDRLCRH